MSAPNYRAEALAWIRAHPDAWQLLVELALIRVRMGRRFSPKSLVERARWDAPNNLFTPAGGYKLNNNHTAYLGRELARQFPETRPFISFRRAGDEPVTASNDDGHAGRVTSVTSHHVDL